MYRAVLLFSCLAACSAHTVLPVAHPVPVHTAVAPVVPYSHGYGNLGLGHGYAAGLAHFGHGHGLIGHGHEILAGHAGHRHLSDGYGVSSAHHLLKRSPTFVPVGHAPTVGHLGGIGHVGAVGHVGHVAPVVVAPVAVAPVPVAPVAVSHQSRVDVRSSPAFIAPVVPVVKPVLAPLLHAAPNHTPLHYGDHYGSAFPHLGYH